MSFPSILLNGLWHSTTPERYENILRDDAILPEPGIPDSSRWHTSRGKAHYPYVRTLGGVSLFDFDGFDSDQYSKEYAASWHTFVPLNGHGGNEIWIEINRAAVQSSIIEGKDLVEKWKLDSAYGHSVMPLIEVAHIGPLKLSAFSRVLQHVNGQWIQLR